VPGKKGEITAFVPLPAPLELAGWTVRRKVEARLNSYPQFITEIDGLDIHFIHVRSKHENALPVIVTHGWPGSIIEQLKIIEPLTDRQPTVATPRTPSTW
ncbi:epoxide hydrolase N-terminal domain-containing protein, partial [Streptomyces chiangmaiensis]